MDLRRLYHRIHATPMRLLGLAGLAVLLLVDVFVLMTIHRDEPRAGNAQGSRVLLLSTLLDEPSTDAIMGPDPLESIVADLRDRETDQEMTDTSDPEGNRVSTPPWYGLCPQRSVTSVDDFRQAVLSNPQLAAYYSDFQWDKARLVKTEAPRLVYVSYQKAGTIVRTTRPKRLPQGDLILTDGVRQARAYCCNEVAEITEAPAVPKPPLEIVDAPLPPPVEIGQTALASPPAELAQPALPVQGPPTAGGPPAVASPPQSLTGPPAAVLPPGFAFLPPGPVSRLLAPPPAEEILLTDDTPDNTPPETILLPPETAQDNTPPGGNPCCALIPLPPGVEQPPAPPIAETPEPSTWTTMGLVLTGLAWWRRRVRRRGQPLASVHASGTMAPEAL